MHIIIVCCNNLDVGVRVGGATPSIVLASSVATYKNSIAIAIIYIIAMPMTINFTV